MVADFDVNQPVFLITSDIIPSAAIFWSISSAGVAGRVCVIQHNLPESLDQWPVFEPNGMVRKEK
jgi:hypothetical protein